MGKIKIHKWSSSKVNDRGKTISQYFLLPGDWNLTELYLRWRSCNCFACFILQVLRSKFEIQGRIRLLSGGCGDKKAGTLVERRREDDGGNSGAVDRNEGLL